MTDLARPLGSLRTHEGWQAFFVYWLFAASTFTMAGMELAVIVLHLLALYHLWRAGIREPLPPWVWAPLGLLPLVAVLTSLINPNTLDSLNELRSEYRIFLPLVLLPALAGCNLRRLLKVYGGFVALAFLIALVQFIWRVELPGPHRAVSWAAMFGRSTSQASGTFTNYLTLGGVMLMPAPVFLSLFLGDSTRDRWWWGAVSVMAALSVLFAQSRAGWLGLAVGLAVLLLRLPRRIALPLLALFLVTTTVGAYLLATGWVRDRFGDVQSPLVRRLVETSLARDGERLLLWEAALNGIADAPVFGHGPSDDAYNRYREAVVAARGAPPFSVPNPRAHNTYLRIAFAHGLVGLAVFLWWWGSVFAWCAVWIRRTGGDFPLESGVLWGVCGALAGSLAQGWFGNHFYDAEIQVSILMWMGLGLFAGLRVRRALAQRAARN